MDLKPLAGKVLIRPDAAPDATPSGLVLVEHWRPEVSGVVVAMGHSRHQRKDEAFALADRLLWLGQPISEWLHGETDIRMEAARMLRELTGREPDVAVGDHVVFGLSAGQEIRINDARYFLLNDTDILAVIAPESEVA